MKKALLITLIVLFFLAGMYVGGYLMFVNGIYKIYLMVVEKTVTMGALGLQLLKIMFGPAVAGAITYIGIIIRVLVDNK